MPEFRYRALTADGRKESGTGSYASEAIAFSSLVSLGLTVVELELIQTDQSQSVSAPSWPWRKVIPLNTQADLAEQMALMFAANLPLAEMLRLLSEGTDNTSVKRTFVRVSQLVADGMLFPTAFKTVAAEFSPLFPSMLAVSYASSNPALILTSLSSYLRRQEQLKSQLGTAIIYPVILVIAAMLVVLLLSFYLAPSLAPMFASMDRPIPNSIAVFLVIRDMLTRYWAALPAIVLLLPLIAAWIAQQFPAPVQTFRSRLPVLGPLSMSLSLARLTRALELLLSSGQPLAVALRETAAFMRGELHAKLFQEAATAIEAGGTASSVFVEEKTLPRMFIELFRYGEATNTLPAVMASLASALEVKAERQTQAMTALIVPALTLVVGGGIAVLVYSVMSAVLSVSDLGAL
jgi:general secretion pathway protein F